MEKATRGAGVTGRPTRFNSDDKGIAVAIQPYVHNPLGVARRGPLVPQGLTRAAPEPDLAGFAGELVTGSIHVGQGEHLVGRGILNDDRHEAVGIETNRFRHGLVTATRYRRCSTVEWFPDTLLATPVANRGTTV